MPIFEIWDLQRISAQANEPSPVATEPEQKIWPPKTHILQRLVWFALLDAARQGETSVTKAYLLSYIYAYYGIRAPDAEDATYSRLTDYICMWLARLDFDVRTTKIVWAIGDPV